MKLILATLLSLLFYGCNRVSNEISEMVRDTVIYYNIRQPHFASGDAYYAPSVEILNFDSYIFMPKSPFMLQTLELTNLVKNTTIILPLRDSTFSNNLFVENYINTYMNHYPLSDNDLNELKRLIGYTHFYVYPSGTYSETIKFFHMHHIVASYENDFDNQSYTLMINDTVFDIKSRIHLKYTNDRYIFTINNNPVFLIHDKILHNNLYANYYF